MKLFQFSKKKKKQLFWGNEEQIVPSLFRNYTQHRDTEFYK